MFRFAHLLIGITLFACASPSAQEPLELTISEIYKDPWAYHGKTVRVRGTFNECVSLSCHFCESAEAISELSNNRDRCMGISFYDDRAEVRPTSSEQNTTSALIAAADHLEEAARFTTSTVEATYDANCTGVPKGAKPTNNVDPDTIVLCTDRAPQLDRAKIIQTHIRRPATAGIITTYGRDKLHAPDAATAAKIITAFHKAASAFSNVGIDPEFLFIVDDGNEWWTDRGISAIGGACTCTSNTCQQVDWPKRYGDIMNATPANPFTCWHAEEVGGEWRFPLQ